MAADKTLNDLRAALLDKQSPLTKALESYDLKALQEAKIDYQKVAQAPIGIAKIDFAANKALMGM